LLLEELSGFSSFLKEEKDKRLDDHRLEALHRPLLSQLDDAEEEEEDPMSGLLAPSPATAPLDNRNLVLDVAWCILALSAMMIVVPTDSEAANDSATKKARSADTTIVGSGQ
jgi:hypothetical protein